MALVQSSLKAQFECIPSGSRAIVMAGTSKAIPEEEVLSRLWILECTLMGLGFSKGSVRSAMLFAIRKRSVRESNQIVRDSAWGLEECLDWLAVYRGAELSSYHSDSIGSGSSSLGDLDHAGATDNKGMRL